MAKIGPREAANQIRSDFQNEHLDPRFQHQMTFAGKVLDQLGAVRTPENTAKVLRLMAKHGIEGSAYVDYPAWVENDRGERAVVNNDEHKAAFMARPEAADAEGNPNPEHGHVDPQTGVFTAGVKPVVYTDDESLVEDAPATESAPAVVPAAPTPAITPAA
jgi:hypothetical protein